MPDLLQRVANLLNTNQKPNTMKKLSFLLLAILFAFAISSCGGEKTNENNDQDSTNTENVSEDEVANPDQKFGVEQGVMEFKMTTMGMTSTMEMYWIDYGKQTATITTMNMMGMNTVSHTLIQENVIYTWDNMTGMGSKVEVDMDEDSQNINYNNLNKEMMDKYHMVEKGTEEVMGKTCKVFTMKYNGVESTTWVYKGMALKSESVVSGIKTTLEVTKLEEGATPPADAFVLPENIKFQDINDQMEDIDAQMQNINQEMDNISVQ